MVSELKTCHTRSLLSLQASIPHSNQNTAVAILGGYLDLSAVRGQGRALDDLREWTKRIDISTYISD